MATTLSASGSLLESLTCDGASDRAFPPGGFFWLFLRVE